MNNLLNTDPDKFFAAMQEFTGKLNEAPTPEWIDVHEGWDYIPISIIETELAKLFFGTHSFKILSERTEKTEIIIVARITCFHPVLHEWVSHDGVGAAWLNDTTPIPLKGAAALAYTEALKVAAKKFGKRFGSDLNRDKLGDFGPEVKTNEDMQPITSKVKVQELSDLMRQNIADCETTEQVVDIYDGNKNMHSNREFVQLIMNRKTTLKKNGNI